MISREVIRELMDGPGAAIRDAQAQMERAKLEAHIDCILFAAARNGENYARIATHVAAERKERVEAEIVAYIEALGLTLHKVVQNPAPDGNAAVGSSPRVYEVAVTVDLRD